MLSPPMIKELHSGGGLVDAWCMVSSSISSISRSISPIAAPILTMVTVSTKAMFRLEALLPKRPPINDADSPPKLGLE